MFRIIRNEAGDEQEELAGYELAGTLVLAGKKPTWKNGFLGSCAVRFLCEILCFPSDRKAQSRSSWVSNGSAPQLSGSAAAQQGVRTVEIAWQESKS